MATTKAKKSAKKASKKGASKARTAVTSVTAARPKMSAETKRQLARGRKLSIQVKRQASFDDMVRELKRRLVIDPGIIGPKGCAPCHSGLDFTVIGEEIVNPG
ncbi:MAG: hypothetical protein JOZ52_06470 [Acidobacteria bacterium]|nr:hypothetical protein [Acidobacteriota bacterium]